jgi:hypothetical protein
VGFCGGKALENDSGKVQNGVFARTEACGTAPSFLLLLHRERQWYPMYWLFD